MLMSASIYGADNEIYIDQSGATANIDLEQLGSGNIMGGLNSVAGTLTALDLDGLNLTLDINQIGDNNKFLGDILGDDITGFFEFDGDSNTFTIQGDPTDTYGIDSSDYNVDVTGGSNTFTLDTGTSALAGTLDLDWIINGDSNTFDFDINYDGATNYVDVDGDSNTVNFTGSGYAGGYFYLDQTGNSRTFNVTQGSTLVPDWLKITSVGNSGTVCVVQNDQGTSKQYREDVVTISLRLVSVSTGEVLVETLVSKSIVSTSVSQDVFRFIEAGTELVEIEGGVAENEVGSIALQKAIETGVFNLIEIGIERGYWEYETININEPSCDDDCIADIRG